ncbi:MAG: AraC family transcriptional regulator, partial [Rhodospirillaceae bacterium]
LPSLQGCIDVSVDNPVVVRQVVDEIDDNAYEPGYFDLFLEGKVITLLAEGLSNRALATGECPYARAALDILTATPLAAPTVAELARRVGLSPRKLAARFQAQYGQTIVEWVADLRIGCARDLVTQSALPIKEISAAVGYAHVPAFSAAFARRFGVSPTRMRAGKTLE